MANRPESLLKFVKSNYAGCAKLTSEQFYDIFKKYDADGNDCIDAKELDLFLQDVQKADPNATNLDALKNEILEKYDANYDGVIQMSELAQCLPLEENFLVGFRKDNVISSVDFMKIFKKYDTDKSGYIEVPELKVFLMDLLDADKKAISPSRINDYASAMIEIFDRNKDGKLELSELSRLLQVEDNFLKDIDIREGLTREQFDDIFSHYDKDGNGDIEGAELDALLMDILKKMEKVVVTTQVVNSYKKEVLKFIDINKDGKLQKNELGLLLSHK